MSSWRAWVRFAEASQEILEDENATDLALSFNRQLCRCWCDTFWTYRVITEEETTDGGNDSKGNGFNSTFGAIDANRAGRMSVTRG